MKKQTKSTIKAHLTRGAFYLLLLIPVCAIPFALAQRSSTERSTAQLTALSGIATATTPTGSPTCTPAWQSEPPMLAARLFASAAVVNSNLYVISGWDGISSPIAETDIFNGTTWAVGAPIPVPHSQSKAAAVGDKIYVPGGGGPIDNMQIYDTITNSWSNGLNLPQSRSGAAVVAFNGKVYIIAGFTGGVDFFPTDTVYEYDPVANTYTLKATMPTQSGNIPGAELNGEIYVVGGDELHPAAFAYNPTNDTWRSIRPPSPPDCQSGGAFALDGELWLVGCLGQNGTVAKIYNPGTNSWRAGPSLVAPQVGGSATAVYNTRGFVAGGGREGTASTTVESVSSCGNPSPSPTPTPTPIATATPPQITLRAAGRKVNGVDTVLLIWSGAASSQVDICRCVQQLNGCNPFVIATTTNDGRYVDSTGHIGQAGFRYRVCEAGTQTCSETAGATFER